MCARLNCFAPERKESAGRAQTRDVYNIPAPVVSRKPARKYDTQIEISPHPVSPGRAGALSVTSVQSRFVCFRPKISEMAPNRPEERAGQSEQPPTPERPVKQHLSAVQKTTCTRSPMLKPNIPPAQTIGKGLGHREPETEKPGRPRSASPASTASRTGLHLSTLRPV